MENTVVDQLNRLEQCLRQPDAVMEPNVWDTVVRYLTLGGKPANVVEFLTEGYHGYPQMASLSCKWLKMAEDDDSAADEASTSEPQDEFSFLQELVKGKFDPEKFADVFTGGHGPPAWLDGLAAMKGGRKLIYDLSAQHRSSLLLNFAIHKILTKGYVEEVAKVGASLASYLGVFHHLLGARLEAAVGAPPERLATISQELKDSCCQSQHTYLHAQLILTSLGRLEGGGAFQRFSQELEAAAAEREQVVWRMQHMLMPEDATATDMEVAALVGIISNSPSLRPSDVAALHRHYHTGATLPSLVPLRQPQLLHLLTAAVFGRRSISSSGSGGSDKVVDQCVELLGLAAAAQELRREDGSLQETDVRDVGGVCSAIREGMRLVLNASQGGTRGMQGEQPAVDMKVLEVPVVSMGVLHAITETVSAPAYYNEPLCTLGVPTFLSVLATILRHHPLLASRILKAGTAGLDAVGSSRIELAKAYTELLAHLVAHGGVMEDVMTYMLHHLTETTIDPSLARHFVFQVLALCLPPYSPRFAGLMARLICAAGVKKSRDAQRDTSIAQLLRTFANACKGMSTSPALSQKELALLQELRL